MCCVLCLLWHCVCVCVCTRTSIAAASVTASTLALKLRKREIVCCARCAVHALPFTALQPQKEQGLGWKGEDAVAGHCVLCTMLCVFWHCAIRCVRKKLNQYLLRCAARALACMHFVLASCNWNRGSMHMLQSRQAATRGKMKLRASSARQHITVQQWQGQGHQHVLMAPPVTAKGQSQRR